ncbi:MAG: bleomycin resistance family protein [Phenylobacterium sp.]|nr:MAG: bleomycin resistance family protein [Phenylobacterium sp.]
MGSPRSAAVVDAGPWYARPVLRVRDAARALGFYAAQLGFAEDWRYAEDGRLRIVQVSRQGCELILSDQWPEEAGGGLTFISLERADFEALRRELAERAVAHAAGHWGYDLVTVEDPDGNRLWFPHPQA